MLCGDFMKKAFRISFFIGTLVFAISTYIDLWIIQNERFLSILIVFLLIFYSTIYIDGIDIIKYRIFKIYNLEKFPHITDYLGFCITLYSVFWIIKRMIS